MNNLTFVELSISLYTRIFSQKKNNSENQMESNLHTTIDKIIPILFLNDFIEVADKARNSLCKVNFAY